MGGVKACGRARLRLLTDDQKDVYNAKLRKKEPEILPARDPGRGW